MSEKCIQRYNIFGELLPYSCNDADGPNLHVNNIEDTPVSLNNVGPCRADGRCRHHVKITTDFELFVWEVLSREQANG